MDATAARSWMLNSELDPNVQQHPAIEDGTLTGQKVAGNHALQPLQKGHLVFYLGAERLRCLRELVL
ncbi:uncharacterized protein PHALS_10302 [Plasmopara halstedii]|uniref:Uncharacterized protein n=1 Tax=Plasmopara halstedii TaxID=4781 RepID=A0A0P1AGU7_PLAHL|nr:uncharacterized protein PHALS_10302 [Plasmopara halstedii]CEG40082.1 hypothetical protein PHALS_10302 [Plasmopara halstedii]|eukprot:XP_024576451.1 hypothetical protein PHALS_10302 [Plasmopara halstedii]